MSTQWDMILSALPLFLGALSGFLVGDQCRCSLSGRVDASPLPPFWFLLYLFPKTRPRPAQHAQQSSRNYTQLAGAS